MEHMVEKIVKPEEVFSIAQFFLRWKYDTAQRIYEKFYIACTSSKEENPLRIFELTNIYYQDVPLEPDNYKGFLLKLDPLLFLAGYSYEEMIPKFSSLFVLKRDVQLAERTSREFTALPAGDRTGLQNEICSPKNLYIRGPKIFAELFKGHENRKPSLAELKIPKEHVWPWLGPILNDPLENKKLQGQKKRNSQEYLDEVAHFVKMAKELGQENPYCLGKMVRHRYPEITNKELVEIVDPESSRNGRAIDQQIHRWLKKIIS